MMAAAATKKESVAAELAWSPAEQLALQGLRWLPAAMALLYAAGLWDADSWVLSTWAKMLGTDFVRQPMAEAYVAAFSFAGWIILFSLLDALPLERFRIVPFSSDSKPAHISLMAMLAILGVFGAIGTPFGSMGPLAVVLVLTAVALSTGTVDLFRADTELMTYTIRSVITFLVYIGAIQAIHFFREPKPSNLGSISFAQLVAELVAGLFAYDFLFSILHFGMHKLGPYASDHRQHHQLSGFSGRVIALDTVNHGLMDGSLQVLVNIFVQNLALFGGPKHKLSRFLHNVVVTGLLVESHAGYDGFWSSHRLFPWVLGGAKRHLAHHHHGKKYYQQFFLYLDDLLFSRLS
mmetsp:Transcript_66758/g.145627  ORF Transcript_66758/g.145627 Transcript_66758/m.145627 type:complete len:349 (+) Transcript_66758:59-1105(+)